MLPQDRKNKILEILRDKQAFKTSEFIDTFKVSNETIRRDLEDLEQQKRLVRVHGGAIPVVEYPVQELNFMKRSEIYIEEKQEIAETVMHFIKEQDCIAMDVSTTNTEIAKKLVTTFDKLTILTNSIEIMMILSQNPNFSIIVPGGILRNEELAIVGDIAETGVSQFNIHLFLMSISGISLQSGLTDYGFGEVVLKKKIHKNSKQTLIVADHSKFKQVAFQKICNIDQVDGIITDSGIDKAITEVYEEAGIRVIHEGNVAKINE